jgi:hypothetical protein
LDGEKVQAVVPEREFWVRALCASSIGLWIAMFDKLQFFGYKILK